MSQLNPIKMNDWEINKFFIAIIVIQISLLILILLDFIGIKIPILREIIGFFYITFVPGILILRVLKLHNLGNIETLLYTVGLSISSVMFLGFFMNLIYPLIGISKPLSLFYLTITITGFVIILSILSYLFDKDYSELNFIDIKNLISNKSLSLCLLPFLAIFSAYIMTFYSFSSFNIILIFLIIVISIIIILVAYDKIPKELYPFTIFVISITLLYSGSLISLNIVEWADLSFEYNIANTILNNSIWIPSIVYPSLSISNLNAVLSITLLAPIYSIITDISILWIFKIIYPLLYSLVPVGMYLVIKRQSNSKIAFMSVFLFIATFGFFTDMLGLNRQQIGEIFIILILLILVNTNIESKKRTILLIIFAFSLIISHYVIAYLFILTLLILFILINIDKKFINPIKIESKKNKIITNGFIILFIIFTFAWYLYTSNSSVVVSIIHSLQNILGSVSIEFLNSKSTQGLSILTGRSSTILGYVYKSIYFTTQLFIIIGLLVVLKFKRISLTNETLNMNKEFVLLCVPFFFIDLAGLLIPNFALTINTSRLYHISLFLLAPLSIIGGLYFFKLLRLQKYAIKLISILLVVYFLFNTGLVYSLAGETTSYFPLNPENSTTPHFTQADMNSLSWLKSHYSDENSVYGDLISSYLIESVFNQFNYLDISYNETLNTKKYYFFSNYNVLNNKIWLSVTGRLNYNITSFSNIKSNLTNNDKIYDNNNAQIYI